MRRSGWLLKRINEEAELRLCELAVEIRVMRYTGIESSR
jgi:hypothetical protein